LGGPDHSPFSRPRIRAAPHERGRYSWGFWCPPARPWAYAGLIELRASSGLENADPKDPQIKYALALEDAIGTRLSLVTHPRTLAPASVALITPLEALEAAHFLFGAYLRAIEALELPYSRLAPAIGIFLGPDAIGLVRRPNNMSTFGF
jgi:hypothetical protein